MKNLKGMSIVEALISVSVVGVIAALAVPGYKFYASKSQASEAITAISHKQTTLASAVRLNRCTVSGLAEMTKTKYGTLVVSGQYRAVRGDNCPIGCNIAFTFNTEGVDKNLQGKVIKVDVLKNLKLRQNSETTLASRYIPRHFGANDVASGANCADLTGKTGSITNGGVSGTEIGEPNPTLPTEPPGGGSEGGGTTPITPPEEPGGGPESGGTTGENMPAGDDLTIHINSTYGGSSNLRDNFYIKPSINVYDAIQTHLGRAPTSETKVNIIVYPDVAVVGDNTTTPAMLFDSRLPSGMGIHVKNNGYILGRGGDGMWSHWPGVKYDEEIKYSPENTAYEHERKGIFLSELRGEYRKNYPFPSNYKFAGRYNTDERYTVDVVYYVGLYGENNGGDAIHVGSTANITIENVGTVSGGGAGGVAVFDFDKGQDSGADAYHGTGGAPFGRNYQAYSDYAGLFTPAKEMAYMANGGLIGKDSFTIPLSAATNSGKKNYAGCAYRGVTIRVKNMGANAKWLGTANCPSFVEF